MIFAFVVLARLSLDVTGSSDSCVQLLFFVSQDPKMYVQTILDVHKKYNALVMSAFNNDAGFVAALDKVSL